MTSQFPRNRGDVAPSGMFGNRRNITYQSKPHKIVPSFHNFQPSKIFPSTHHIKKEVPSPPQQNHFTAHQRPQVDIFNRFSSFNQEGFSHGFDVMNGSTTFGIAPPTIGESPFHHPPPSSSFAAAKTTQPGDFPQLDTKLVSEVLNFDSNGANFDGGSQEEKNLSLNFEKNLSIEDNLSYHFGEAHEDRPQMFGGAQSSRFNPLYNPFAVQDPPTVQSEASKFQSHSRNGNNNNQVSPPVLGDLPNSSGVLPALGDNARGLPNLGVGFSPAEEVLKSPPSLDLNLAGSPVRGQRSLGSILQEPKLVARATPGDENQDSRLMSATSLDLNEIDSCYLNNF